MFKSKRFFYSLQILIVVSLLILPLLISYESITNMVNSKTIVAYLIFCATFLAIHFVHRYFLVPKLYLKEKTPLYIVSLLVILAILVLTRPYDYLLFELRPNHNKEIKHSEEPPSFSRTKPAIETHKRSKPKVDVLSIFLFLIIITVEIIIETNKQLNLTMQRALSAEAQKTEAELSFLKAQVNPHFLFNTLNNIYTLAIIKDENTAPSIMKLSNIMRYITDEAGNDFVSLRKEIDCIEDFIALQKLRLGKKTTLHYEIKGSFEVERKIAPLMLMAFVENVFKYGISNHSISKLIIKIAIEDNILSLMCQNPIYPDKKNTERSGIGLTNTKKRLAYIYPNKHILVINDDQLFTVKLTIHL